MADSNQPADYFSKLSVEVQLQILQELPSTSLRSIAQTSKPLRALLAVHQKTICRENIKRHFLKASRILEAEFANEFEYAIHSIYPRWAPDSMSTPIEFPVPGPPYLRYLVFFEVHAKDIVEIYEGSSFEGLKRGYVSSLVSSSEEMKRGRAHIIILRFLGKLAGRIGTRAETRELRARVQWFGE